MLATAGRNGATQAVLSALGFDASMIAELVNRGLVTLTAEKVRAGGKLMAVARRGSLMRGGMLSPLKGNEFRLCRGGQLLPAFRLTPAPRLGKVEGNQGAGDAWACGCPRA